MPPVRCKEERSSEEEDEGKTIQLNNPYLDKMPSDHLYHLALGTESHDLKEMFSDIKFVCMGGTPKRMEGFAHFMKKELDIKLPTGTNLCDISARSYRYCMFKVGPVLSVSHGMGAPSLSILIHEIFKLIHYAGCKDVTFIRIGTSGGIGVKPGTVVVSKGALDGLLRPVLEMHILGKVVLKPAILDQELANEIITLGEKYFPDYNIVGGKTICANDFYEGQGRLDGAFCDYTEEDKMAFIEHVMNNGAVNFEMESVQFAAMCHQAKVKGAIVCVTLLNRLDGDQVTIPKDIQEEWQFRPQKVVAQFIKQRLGLLPK